MATSPQPKAAQSGFWPGGCDSLNDPAFIGQYNYVWGFNGVHRGGRFRCRPGFGENYSPIIGVQTDAFHPQGFKMFKPTGGPWYKVVAHGGLIYISMFPFVTWTQLQGIQFYKYAQQIIFEKAVKSTITNPDGSLTFVDQPYAILMIQDGSTRAAYWDGTTARHLDPGAEVNETPIGQAMKWNNQRLWVGDGSKIHASNEGDPLTYTEEKIPAQGGFFVTNSGEDVTAIGETPDQKALLVFTYSSTDTFQSSILDRTQWETTQGFQTQLFKNIGCVGPKAWINQYGLTYWMSFKGVIELDLALQTYRTKRLRYSDYGVARSKAKLHKNLRGVCAGQYENFLFFSWPSADRFNAHTVVMDEMSFQSSDAQAAQVGTSGWSGAWKGIRPVEWCNEVINGVNRCFVLSRDYPPVFGSNYIVGLWEAFSKQRADITLDGVIHPIRWGFESKQLHLSADIKKISTIEFDLSELKHGVDYTISFNGRRSGFTKVGEGHIDASQFNPDPDDINEYRPQSRTVRSKEILIANAQTVSVQDRYPQTIDLGFGAYFEAVGEGAIDALRVWAEPQPELALGRVEKNEEKARLVDWGNTEVLTDEPPAPVYIEPQASGFTDSISERMIEPFYSSRE